MDVKHSEQCIGKFRVLYLPILGFVCALTVRLGELALGVQRGACGHELGHGVHVRGEVV